MGTLILIRHAETEMNAERRYQGRVDPPLSERGIIYWLRSNLFATPSDIVLTIVGLVIVALVVPPIVDWAFIEARWTGLGRDVCASVTQGGIQPEGWSGACWAFVSARWKPWSTPARSTRWAATAPR